MKLTFLGTGHAMVTRCYNTCFALHDEKEIFLVDAGGGNGILGQLQKAALCEENITHFFVTHAHTDHLLGAIWILRKVASQAAAGKRTRPLFVYGHGEVLSALTTICRLTLSPKHFARLGKEIVLKEVLHGQTENLLEGNVTFFDIASSKMKQFGFRAVWPDGNSLVCLGDEPCRPSSRPFAQNARWLLSEAFCLEKQKDVFHPYEKHHGTAADAGKLAQELNAGNLVLYHTEDSDVDHRAENYAAEASAHFHGKVFVPEDLQTFNI